MDIQEFTESIIKQRDINILFEAVGADAWNDARGTIREVVSALAANDAPALMSAMRPEFLEYMYSHAEQQGLVLENMDNGEYMDSAECASNMIDRDNAQSINQQLEHYGYMGTG